jgi:NAD-dependent dihydropyrimidine dehydrogenase PreA subunit
MTYVIMSACEGVKDGSCVKVCPVDCIHEGETMFYIDPVECIACGLCETICPEDAIRPIDEVPEEEASYIEKNAEFFKGA